jgi:hypothetical protein
MPKHYSITSRQLSRLSTARIRSRRDVRAHRPQNQFAKDFITQTPNSKDPHLHLRYRLRGGLPFHLFLWRTLWTKEHDCHRRKHNPTRIMHYTGPATCWPNRDRRRKRIQLLHHLYVPVRDVQAWKPRHTPQHTRYRHYRRTLHRIFARLRAPDFFPRLFRHLPRSPSAASPRNPTLPHRKDAQH